MATKNIQRSDGETKKVHGPASYFPSIEKKYGRPIAEWKNIICASDLTKHMELVNWLKAEHARSRPRQCPRRQHSRRSPLTRSSLTMTRLGIPERVIDASRLYTSGWTPPTGSSASREVRPHSITASDCSNLQAASHTAPNRPMPRPQQGGRERPISRSMTLERGDRRHADDHPRSSSSGSLRSTWDPW
jgi:hypothetical protein